MALNQADPKKYKEYFRQKGYSLEVLSKCNSQEFKYIGGYGRGYFLIDSATPHTTNTVQFGETPLSVNLIVTDRIGIDHPGMTGRYLYLLMTAEPKHKLDRFVVERNYNVISKITLDDQLQFDVLEPDDMNTPDLEGVIEDLLTDTGFTLSYDGTPIQLYDIFVQGMTTREAIDHLCSAYGLVWTADNTMVYIFSPAESASSSSSAGGIPGSLTDPINDIRHRLSDRAFNVQNTSFPAIDHCLKKPESFYTVKDDTNEGQQGAALATYDPYFYSVYDEDGELRNLTALENRADTIQGNMEAIGDWLHTYVAKHIYEFKGLDEPPGWLSVIYGDFGDGPRSVFHSRDYPFLRPPYPPRKDRVARRWIGTIAEEYDAGSGPVTTIKVTPDRGLDGDPPTGVQDVHNEYNWDYGQVGWKIGVERDCDNERWIGFQQEYDCPDETSA